MTAPRTRKRRKNKLSLSANILMLFLGLFTFVLVDRVVGAALMAFSVFLYAVYVWFHRRMDRTDSRAQ